jgi:hypothetical protein
MIVDEVRVGRCDANRAPGFAKRRPEAAVAQVRTRSCGLPQVNRVERHARNSPEHGGRTPVAQHALIAWKEQRHSGVFRGVDEKRCAERCGRVEVTDAGVPAGEDCARGGAVRRSPLTRSSADIAEQHGTQRSPARRRRRHPGQVVPDRRGDAAAWHHTRWRARLQGRPPTVGAVSFLWKFLTGGLDLLVDRGPIGSS